jgi:hypothetical protein
VAVDSAGNLFIADTGNGCIRRVSTDGIITTVAGNGKVGYSGDGGPATSAQLNLPAGVAVDGVGNLFIADHCRPQGLGERDYYHGGGQRSVVVLLRGRRARYQRGTGAAGRGGGQCG